jgi:heme/copper-type cytochrome/quinol oxidase subunit 4
MIILNVALGLFILLELMNVIALYFNPTLKQANGVGVFKAWEKSKKDSETHNLMKYLVYWVAATKFIFLALLIVILLFGDPLMKLVGTIALILSISLFYWRMYPLIKEMDLKNELTPKGYSKQLGFMISIIITILTFALIATFYFL